MDDLRTRLVTVALEWEEKFGNAPHITTALSEYDAACLLKMTKDEYCTSMQGVTAVQRGFDLKCGGYRYQVKANRPSGKPGSNVTLVPKARNYDWDYLIWILYDKEYRIVEAWRWSVELYRDAFDSLSRLSPKHYRTGEQLYPITGSSLKSGAPG